MRLILLALSILILSACSGMMPTATLSDPSGPGKLLLTQAQTHQDNGEVDQAIALVERAVRIEPRNPYAWHRLAQLQLSKGNLHKAIQFAKRSNQFSNNNQRLKALNEKIINHVEPPL